MTPIETVAAHILRSVFTGRRIILVGGSLPALHDLGTELMGMGAARPFLLASNRGDGRTSALDGCSLDVCKLDIPTAMHEYERLLADPPPTARSALAAYDPDRTAEALGTIILSYLPEVAGRRRYAVRPASWIALEDKLAAEAFWDRAGIPHAPSLTVGLDAPDLYSTAQQLNGPAGTVWTGDARDGVHGGGSRVRWVRTAQEARRAAEWFRDHCGSVRIMPFLDGIPCSIHGVVTTGGVAVFRPVELLCLIRPSSGEFIYAGASTYWDPSPEARTQMRRVARRTGETLRREVAYRGPFVVDGVLTADGFLPTELNTRIGMGLVEMSRGCPGLHLPLLALAIQAGDCTDTDLSAAELERHVVQAADRERHCTIHTAVLQPVDRVRTVSLRQDGTELTVVPSGGAAALVLSPSLVGGFLSCAPDATQLQVGDSLRTLAASAVAAADRHLGTRLGPVRPASYAR